MLPEIAPRLVTFGPEDLVTVGPSLADSGRSWSMPVQRGKNSGDFGLAQFG